MRAGWGSVPRRLVCKSFFTSFHYRCLHGFVGFSGSRSRQKVGKDSHRRRGRGRATDDDVVRRGSRGEQRNGNSKIGCVVFVPSRSILKTSGKRNRAMHPIIIMLAVLVLDLALGTLVTTSASGATVAEVAEK